MTDEEVVIQIQRIARQIRGQILEIFTNTEVLIDDIIRKTTFTTESEYDSYMEILQKGELTMSVKKKLLKMCIDKFQLNYNQDLSILSDKIDNIIDKRNQLAHWLSDRSVNGINLFKEKSKIRLITTDKNRRILEVYFDHPSTKKLEEDIFTVTGSLILMQKTIDNDIASRLGK